MEGVGGGGLVGIVLVLTRVGTVFLLSPYSGLPFIPGMVRVSAALAVTGLLVIADPAARTAGALGPGPLGLGLLGEVAAGLLLVLGLGLTFYSAQLAGSVVDYQMGYGFAAVADPNQPSPTPMLGRFYYYTAMAVFLAMGGDRAFLATVWASFRLMPPGGVLLGEHLPLALGSRAAEALALGVQLAAPVLAALFLTDILLGTVARSMPQLNPFFIGMPVKALAGLLVLGGAMPAVAAVLRGGFFRLTSSLVELMSLVPPAIR